MEWSKNEGNKQWVNTQEPVFNVLVEAGENPLNTHQTEIVEAVGVGGAVTRSAAVWDVSDLIVECVEKNQVCILTGGTGCGKSTGIPVILYENNWGGTGMGRIGVVVPTAIGARTLAHFVRSLLRLREDDYIVGYNSKSGGQWDRQITKILFFTNNVLLEEFQKNPMLPDFDVIILDDAHLRTMKQELTLALLKRLIDVRKHSLRLIVSSASLDIDTWVSYFMDRPETLLENKDDDLAKKNTMCGSGSSSGVGILEIPIKAKNLKVEVFTLKVPCADYLREALNTVLQIHKNESDGAILVFLPGADEILAAVHWIKEWNERLRQDDSTGRRSKLYPLRPLAIYPNQSLAEQQKAVAPVAFESSTSLKHGRKVVFAHPMAESTLTIVDVSFVVDALFEEREVYHATLGPFITVRGAVPTSKVSIIQRSGRVGRVRAGKVYQLASKEDIERRMTTAGGVISNYPLPQLWGDDLTTLIMLMKSLGFKRLNSLDFLTPPPVRSSLMALETLQNLNIIDNEGNLSNVGRFAVAFYGITSNLQVSLMAANALLIPRPSYDNEKSPLGLWEVITMLSVRLVGALYNSPPKSSKPSRKRPGGECGRSITEKYWIARARLSASDGDLISMYNVLTACDTQLKHDCDFAKDHFIDRRRLEKARAWRLRLINCSEKLINSGYPFTSWTVTDSDEETLVHLKKSILKSSILNVVYHEGQGSYRLLRHGSQRTSNNKTRTLDIPAHGKDMPDTSLSPIFRIHPDSVTWGAWPAWAVFQSATSLWPGLLYLKREHFFEEESEAWRFELEWLKEKDREKKNIIFHIEQITTIDPAWLME